MKKQPVATQTKVSIADAVHAPQFQDAMYSMAAVFSLLMTATLVFWYLTSGI